MQDLRIYLYFKNKTIFYNLKHRLKLLTQRNINMTITLHTGKYTLMKLSYNINLILELKMIFILEDEHAILELIEYALSTHSLQAK